MPAPQLTLHGMPALPVPNSKLHPEKVVAHLREVTRWVRGNPGLGPRAKFGLLWVRAHLFIDARRLATFEDLMLEVPGLDSDQFSDRGGLSNSGAAALRVAARHYRSLSEFLARGSSNAVAREMLARAELCARWAQRGLEVVMDARGFEPES